jgi:hypothetical protein
MIVLVEEERVEEVCVEERTEEAGSPEEVGSLGKLVREGCVSASHGRDRCHQGEFVLTI